MSNEGIKYDKSKSLVSNIRDASAILTFIVMITGMFSSTAFFYLDYRNDQRYLKLVEITTKLDPLYISIASAKAQQDIEDVTELEDKIFRLRFKKNELKNENKKLEPYDAALLSKHIDELNFLQSKP